MLPIVRESLETSENRLQDPQLRRYYDNLRAIAHGDDLFSVERFRTILRMNAGSYDDLIDRTFYRHAGSRVPLGALAVVRDNGTPWNFARQPNPDAAARGAVRGSPRAPASRRLARLRRFSTSCGS